MPLRGARLALVLVAAVAPARLFAEPPPVLHEYVPLGPLRCEGGVCQREARTATATSNPDAIEAGGKVLEAPSGPPTAQKGEQIYEPQPAAPVVAGGGSPPVAGDPPPERRDRVRMDRFTAGEPPGKHVYHEVFNPAVFPFKRMTALDAVADDGALYVAQPTLRGLPVLGASARGPASEAFWGSVVVDLAPDRWVPIPSSAAGVRILSYQVEPPVRLDFARDGADSVFVRGSARGQHRLTWLEEAPAAYFGGPLPPGLRIADEPAELLHPVPARLRADAERVLRRIGVDRRLPLKDTLDRLVEWFRNFEMGQLPEEGTPYLDIAMNQKGVCRHRSYAFTITALAVGIPTRYIENELHVYVEVYVPRVGWRRVNLGGASVDEEVQNMDGKVLHKPRAGDPFPMPEAFRHTRGGTSQPNASSAMLQEVYDASRRGRDDDGAGSTGRGAGDAPAGGDPARAATAGNPRNGGTGGDPAPPRASAGDPPDGTPPPTAPPAANMSAQRLARTALEIESDAHDVFRGDAVNVRGRFSADGASPAGVRVSIELAGAGGLLVPVGDVATGPDGRWSATLSLPRTLPLGRYRIVAHTAGDAVRAPARVTATPRR